MHHVAWRTPNDAQQPAWQREIAESGLRVTQVMDRQYFRSIYFRERGGVLFEITTDPPGSMRNEPLAEMGFSQGPCLVLEFTARHARRYGGIIGLSGGLIGPAGTPRNYPGSLAGTPVFLGCSDVDPHIPKERVIESADVLKRLGADVTARLYPNMGHTINQDELDFVRKMMNGLPV